MLYHQNMGIGERLVRFFVSILFMGLFPMFASSGIMAFVLFLIGFVIFITSILGYCPIKPLLKKKGAEPPEKE